MARYRRRTIRKRTSRPRTTASHANDLPQSNYSQAELETKIAETEVELAKAATALNEVRLKDAEVRKAVAVVHDQIEANAKRIHRLLTSNEFSKKGLRGFFSPGLVDEAKQELDQLNESYKALVQKANEITGHPMEYERDYSGFVKGLMRTLDRQGIPLVDTRFTAECQRLSHFHFQLTLQLQQLKQAHRRLKSQFNAERKAVAAEERKRKKTTELELLKAKAASVDGTARDLADSIKRKLASQEGCPYCGGNLGRQPHADHIYPLSKGGHSVIANMVMVCAECNIKKGAMTLRAFIIKHGLDRETVEARLHQLGKDF